MYCPSCGIENAEGASFCRGCGANVSLVPQALSGHLPASEAGAAGAPGFKAAALAGKRPHGPRIENAVVPFFMGLAFICVAFALAVTRMGRGWWFWLFIPAFGMMGRGVAEYLRLKQHEKTPLAGAGLREHTKRTAAAVAPAPDTGALPPYEPPAGYTPGSVTDATTRLLEQDRKR